jgi:tRNA (cmo5U34)-methyltransferase
VIIQMMPESESHHDERWKSADYVATWIANRAPEVERVPLRKKLVSLLPFEVGADIRVLDLGTGTGLLSLAVLNTFQNARIVCQDFSGAMLNNARENLAKFEARVYFVNSDLRESQWRQVVDGTFDAVVAGFALHSIPERIHAIYREVFDLVRPGGCFISCDNVSAPGTVTARLYREERHVIHRENLKAELGPDKSLEILEKERLERESVPARQTVRVSYTLVEQIGWLREAGFDEADCLWKDMRRAIIGGFRHGRM